MTAGLKDHNQTLVLAGKEEMEDGAPIPAGEGQEAIDPVPIPRAPRPNNEKRASERGAAAMWETSSREAWDEGRAPPLLLAMVAAAATPVLAPATTAPAARGGQAALLQVITAAAAAAVAQQQLALGLLGPAGGGGRPATVNQAVAGAGPPPLRGPNVAAAAAEALVDLSQQGEALDPARSLLLLPAFALQVINGHEKMG